MDYFDLLKEKMKHMAKDALGEEIRVVSARPLSPEEAIGKPDRTDYPILKGKEVMIEATFRESRGQAFTDMPGNFQGSLQDLVGLELKNSFERAIFVAGLNAVMRYFGHVSGTIHCKNAEPKQCAEQLPAFVTSRFGKPKIAFIGYQPAMIEKLVESFQLRVVDLDKDNIGATRFGRIVEGPDNTDDCLSWCDLILATGSTCVNGTITTFLNRKPVIFYGMTVSGPAAIYGYKRFCPCSK